MRMRTSASSRPSSTSVRSITTAQVVCRSAVDATSPRSIVAESNLGYGVVVVGVAERHEGVLYSPMVDELLLNAVTPVVIVRRARGLIGHSRRRSPARSFP